MEPSCILDINCLLDVLVRILPVLSFHSVNCFFAVQKLLSWMRPHVSIFIFIACPFVVKKKIVARTGVTESVRIFSCSSCVILGLAFVSFITLSWCFTWKALISLPCAWRTVLALRPSPLSRVLSVLQIWGCFEAGGITPPAPFLLLKTACLFEVFRGFVWVLGRFSPSYEECYWYFDRSCAESVGCSASWTF